MKRLFLVSFLTLFIFTPTAFAEDYLFPLPADPWNVPHGYEHDGAFWSHQGGKAKYSIDFQLAAFDRERFRDFSDKCHSLGAPILAARPGKIIDIRKPSGDYLNLSYGHMVRVGYDDDSYTWYAHFLENTFAVELGEEVKAGQVLGLLGATGYTKGGNCYWENDLGFQFNNYAPHLHFETNTSGGLAILQEPLVGAENYSSITKAKSPYISNTTMQDPKSFWSQWQGKVPYRLNYNYVPGQIIGENWQPKVHSIFPLYTRKGQMTTFTLHGKEMTQNMIVDMEGCEPEFRKQKHYEQIFRCFIYSESPNPFLYGEIWSSEERKKEAEENSDIKPDLQFNIRILEEGESLPTSSIIKTIGFGGEKWPEYDRRIFVLGHQLPHDLRLDMPGCEHVNYIFRSANRQEMVCTLPSYTNQQSQTKLKGYLISDSSGMREPITLQADYSSALYTVSPPHGIYGQRESFVFHGPNLGRTRAAYISNCGEIEIEPINTNSVRISCNPQVETHLFSPQLKKEYQSGVHHFILKAEAGSDQALAEGYLRFDMPSQTWVDSITPQHPILEQSNPFKIEGDHLPKESTVWIDNCQDDSNHLAQTNNEKSSMGYNCYLSTNGGKDQYNHLKIVLNQGDHDTMANALKNQERRVEIKLSEQFSAGEPAVLYRGTLEPITEYQQIWMASKTRTPEENESVIQKILEADGNYKDDLVNQFGWIKAKSENYNNIKSKGLSSGQIGDLKKTDNYLLTTCPRESYIQPLIERRLAYRIFKEEEDMIPWLPTFGYCAEKVNKLFLNEGMSVYPTKSK